MPNLNLTTASSSESAVKSNSESGTSDATNVAPQFIQQPGNLVEEMPIGGNGRGGSEYNLRKNPTKKKLW